MSTPRYMFYTPPLAKLNQIITVSVSKSVDYIQGVHACIVRNTFGNYFKGFGKHVHYQLLFAWNLNSKLFQPLGKLHFSSSSTGYNLVCFKASSDDHNCIVERSFSLFDELFSTTSENDCGWFCLKLIYFLHEDILQTGWISQHQSVFIGNFHRFLKHQKQLCLQ